MAVSGTTSTTLFNTRKVIDTAYRRCRIPPQVVTGEMLDTARSELYLMLSALSNKGAPLWKQTKQIMPLSQGLQLVTCPIGSVDILNANLRSLNRLTGTATSSSGTADNAFDSDLDTLCTLAAVAQYIQLALAETAIVTTCGVLPGATGTWSFTIESSDDGITFTVRATITAQAVVDGQWYWFDIDGAPSALYWRIVGGATTTLSLRELDFANTPSEVPMSRINKDDYYSLPNKSFQGRPVQYWLDRQRAVPIMNVWPAPDGDSIYRQVVALVHMHIMDVGTYTQDLDIPQRWFDAIVSKLALKLARITPEAKPEFIPDIRAEAQEAETTAWAEERDNSPTYLQVDISPYTR